MKFLYYDIEKAIKWISRDISFNNSLNNIIFERSLDFLNNNKTLNKDKIYIY